MKQSHCNIFTREQSHDGCYKSSTNCNNDNPYWNIFRYTDLNADMTILYSNDYWLHSTAHATVSITSNTGGAAVCPGQELVLTCVAENTVALRWRVFSSLHGSSFIEKTFTGRSSPGAQYISGFTFKLVSNSNNRFESLLMTEATQPLHNIVIECHSTSLESSFTLKIESKN